MNIYICNNTAHHCESPQPYFSASHANSNAPPPLPICAPSPATSPVSSSPQLPPPVCKDPRPSTPPVSGLRRILPPVPSPRRGRDTGGGSGTERRSSSATAAPPPVSCPRPCCCFSPCLARPSSDETSPSASSRWC